MASFMATVGPWKELRNSSTDLVFLSSPFETGVPPIFLPLPTPSLLSSDEFNYERTLLSCLSIYCSYYHHSTVLSIHLTASCLLLPQSFYYFLVSAGPFSPNISQHLPVYFTLRPSPLQMKGYDWGATQYPEGTPAGQRFHARQTQA